VVKIFHNPNCGTSRNTLAPIRNSGVEPEVVLYLETPPSKEQLKKLISDMSITVRDVLRQKGTPYEAISLLRQGCGCDGGVSEVHAFDS